MKTVELSELMAGTIEAFCENAAELGCPRKEEVDMWFRNLLPKEQCAVCDKLLDIMDRDYEMYKEYKEPKCSKKTDKILSKIVPGCSGKTKVFKKS
jgi:hypothetical protein